MGSGGVVVNNDIPVTQHGYIRNGIAENINLHQTEAVFQLVNLCNQIVIHENMGQRLKHGKLIDTGQHIVRTVNGLQGTVLRELGQSLNLVAGEIQDFR